MKSVATHLWFNGDCAAAMALYAHCFGGTVLGEPDAGAPGTSPGVGAEGPSFYRMVSNALVLVGSDSPPGWPFENASAASMEVVCDSLEEMDVLLTKLLSGGRLLSAPPVAGEVERVAVGTDAFGVEWTVRAPRAELVAAGVAAFSTGSEAGKQPFERED